MDETPTPVGLNLVATPPPPAPPVAAGPEGPDAFTVNYQLTQADIRSAGLAGARYSVFSNAFGAFIACTGAFAFVVSGDVVNLVIAIVGLAWLSGVLTGLLTAVIAGRRPEIMQQPTTMTVSATGIRSVTGLGSGDAAWAMYKRVRVTRTTLLFELGTGAVVLIPTRIFDPGQLNRLLVWAEVAGVLDRSSPLGAYAKGIALGVLVAVAIPAVTWLVVSTGTLT